LVLHVWYFFLGITSHIMTPCTGFPVFFICFEFPLPPFQI
jgi:hypothetical protein